MGKLRFRLSHAISRVLLVNLRRAYRVKPVRARKRAASKDFSGVSSPKKADNRLSVLPVNQKAFDMSYQCSSEACSSSCASPSLNGGESMARAEAGVREEKLSLIEQSHKQGRISNRRKGSIFGSSCCRQDAIAHENCQYRVSGKASLSSSEEMWDREGFWSVIAEVDNQIVRKKVVLKKRKGSKRTKFPIRVPEGRRAPVNSENSEDEYNECLVVKESKCQGCSNFRLSTSSGDASLNPDVFAWDKEHSLFASDDSPAGLNKVPCVTLSDEQPCVSSSEDDFSISSSQETIGLSSRRSTSRSDNRKKSPKKHAVVLKSEKVLSSSCKPCDRSRRFNALESNAKMWDSDRFFTSASAGGDLANHRVPSRKRISVKRKDYALIQHGTGNKQCDGDLPAVVRGKVRESVPVMMFSSDPYQDFKQSMVQMILEKGLNNCADLEELLECYLYLNSPGFHEVIIRVFSDLWLQAFEAQLGHSMRIKTSL